MLHSSLFNHIFRKANISRLKVTISTPYPLNKMAQRGAVNDDKAWSAQASEYAKFMKRKSESQPSPMAVPIDQMLRKLNAAKPLSSATGLMAAGCGTGQGITNLFEEYGSEIPSSARLVASDFSEGMLNVLRETASRNAAEGNNLWERLETEVMDMQNLTSLPDGSLSHVFSSFVLGMIPDNKKALQEVNRVLTPGGVFVEVSWAKITWMEWLFEMIDRRWPKRIKPLPWPADFTSTAGLRGLFEDAGFINVETEEAEGILGGDSISEFVRMFSRSKNPGMSFAFQTLDESELEEAEKILEEDLRKKFPDEKVRMVGIAIIALGFKK